MKRLAAFGCFVGLALVLASPGALAAGGPPRVSGTDLVTRAFYYNGRTIAFQGEVVGSPVDRGNDVWVNITDGSYALGALVPKADASHIHVWGSFWQVGDTVEVVGTFYRADSTTGGETDIHASSLIVLKPGHPVAHPVPPILFGGTLAAVALAAVLYLVDRGAKRRHESVS